MGELSSECPGPGLSYKTMEMKMIITRKYEDRFEGFNSEVLEKISTLRPTFFSSFRQIDGIGRTMGGIELEFGCEPFKIEDFQLRYLWGCDITMFFGESV